MAAVTFGKEVRNDSRADERAQGTRDDSALGRDDNRAEDDLQSAGMANGAQLGGSTAHNRTAVTPQQTYE